MEIHKPHAAKTWREFFIELGTIIAGILIAIALEQTLDYFRHIDQLHTVRGELTAEIEENQEIAAHNAVAFAKIRAALAHDIAILRAGEANPRQLATGFDYSWDVIRTQDGAWQAGKQSGALELMPRDELRRYAFIYHAMDDFMNALNPAVTQMEIAGAIAHRAPDGALTPRDREELLTATSEAQGRLAFAERIMQFEQTGLKSVLSSR